MSLLKKDYEAVIADLWTKKRAIDAAIDAMTLAKHVGLLDDPIVSAQGCLSAEVKPAEAVLCGEGGK